jgi:transposase-like protein
MVQYTEEQRVDALARLEINGGNVLATSREVGISRATLRRWRNEVGAVEEGVRMATAMVATEVVTPAERWLAVANQATDLLSSNLTRYNKLKTLLAPDDLRRVAVVAGIAADKHLDYRDGRASNTTNVQAIAQAAVTVVRQTRSTA